MRETEPPHQSFQSNAKSALVKELSTHLQKKFGNTRQTINLINETVGSIILDRERITADVLLSLFNDRI